MRVRVSLRALWALLDKRRLLNPCVYPLFSWQLLSHKLFATLPGPVERVADIESEVGGELEALMPDVIRNQLVETGLVDGDFAGCQFPYLGFVHIDADYLRAEFGETGTRNQPHIPAANYGYFTW